MTLMATEKPANTSEPVAFDRVRIGDELTFLTVDNGFGGSGGDVQRVGVVISKTDKTVIVRTPNYGFLRREGHTARLRRADWSPRCVRRTRRVERLSYDAAHVIYRDQRSTVTALWTPDPDLAERLRTCDDDTFEQLLLNRDLEIEPICSAMKIRREWFINDGTGDWNPAATRKTDALTSLRAAVAEYFNR